MHGPRACPRNAQFGAKERGADFRDQLFGGIGSIAKALAKLAIEAMLRTSPVGELMDIRVRRREPEPAR